MRARLGYTGEREKFADEDKVSFDEDYMACDLVINWAAEGLVLCFIHAVVGMWHKGLCTRGKTETIYLRLVSRG